MKRIILFDTSVATQNKGDEIIMESIRQVMQPVLKDAFVHSYPTHLVSFPFAHNFSSPKARLANVSNYKFICGTNLFWTRMFRINPLLNVNIFNCGPYTGSVLLGVGYDAEQCGEHIGPYSRYLWRKVLSHEYIHSTRDDKTKKYLEMMGLKAVNTGCPTLWPLTPKHCAQIPTKKADKVVFTLSSTGGEKPENDKQIIELLLKNYKEVYFWSQTFGGFKSVKSYPQASRLKYINPDLGAYCAFLQENDVDYIGTRLHGGVYAMQQKKRAIILSVDHRAEEFKKYNIQSLSEYDLIGLENMINTDFQTKITIDYGVIEKWMGQFLRR